MAQSLDNLSLKDVAALTGNVYRYGIDNKLNIEIPKRAGEGAGERRQRTQDVADLLLGVAGLTRADAVVQDAYIIIKKPGDALSEFLKGLKEKGVLKIDNASLNQAQKFLEDRAGQAQSSNDRAR